MLSYLISHSELSQLFRFLSPNWLKVTSPTSILKLVAQLKKNHSDHEYWIKTKASCSSCLTRLGLEKGGKLTSPTAPRAALQIFFGQVLFQETWILDFRSDSFKGRPNEWSWLPQPYLYQVKPDFLTAIRGLYRGFYRDDHALFAQSLASLQLSPAEAALRKHFGSGDQSQVRFQLATFQSTFAEVFESCARAGVKLDSDFFILGFMLLGLYENLEKSGESFDVRSIFLALDRS